MIKDLEIQILQIIAMIMNILAFVAVMYGEAKVQRKIVMVLLLIVYRGLLGAHIY